MPGKVVVFGTGPFAEVVRFYLNRDSDYEVVAFTVSGDKIEADEFGGLPVVPFEDVENRYSPTDNKLFVAAGYAKMNRLRARFCGEAKAKGYELISYVNSKATCWGDTRIGENCFVFEDNTIQPFVTLGNDVILWSGNHIGHHATIGDHCFISSHVVVSGQVSIGPYCFVGVNATFHDSVSIGEACFVGAGSIIAKSFGDKQVFHPKGTEPRGISSDKLRF